MATKLESLNNEQVALMEKVKNDWLSFLFREDKKIDTEKIKEGVEWLYSFSNLKKPITIIVDSPLGAQYAVAMLRSVVNTSQVWNQVLNQVRNQVGNQVENQVWNQVKNQVRNQVGNQVGNQVENQVWNQVRNQVWNQVGNQVENQVRNQVWNQVGNQVRNQVLNQVRNQVGNQVRSQVLNQVGNQVKNQVWSQVLNQVEDEKLKYESFASFGNILDLGWLSFYNFFDQIGIDLGTSKNDFKKFSELIKVGVYDMIQLDGVCIVSTLPKAIRRNQNNDLHDAKLPAIEWADGYKLFYLNGVSFDETLFERVVSRQMSLEEVLKIEDIDQRKQAMRFVNVWDFIKEARGVEVDTYTKTGKDERTIRYWLYEFPANTELFPKGAKYMVYDDSMVGAAEQHMQGVLMEHKTVAEAMSWKQSDDLFTLSPAEWEALELDIHFT